MAHLILGSGIKRWETNTEKKDEAVKVPFDTTSKGMEKVFEERKKVL